MLKRVAQIRNSDGYVVAVIRPSTDLVAPEGMTFIFIEEEVENPCGKTWDGNNFNE